MTDIVERLRNAVGNIGIRDASKYDARVKCSDLIEAADEIERLREALKPFADQAAEFDSPVDGFKGDVPDDYYQECSHHTIGDLRAARKALEPKP